MQFPSLNTCSQYIVLCIFYLLLTGLNILDGYSTWQVLKPDKFHLEFNPVARWLFRKLGIPNGIIIVETAWIAGYTVVLSIVAAYNLLLTFVLLCLGIIVFTWVVWDNLRIIRKMKSQASASKEKQSV